MEGKDSDKVKVNLMVGKCKLAQVLIVGFKQVGTIEYQPALLM